MNFLIKINIVIFFICVSYSASSQIQVINGKDTSYYKSVDEYEQNNAIRDGYWKEYFTKDKIKEEGKYINNKKEGRWVSYFINGNKKQIMFYENGIANGKVRIFYENGNISEEGTWNGNERFWTGDYKFYYENGNPSYIWTYDNNGKRTGVQRYFHENGNLSIEGEWKEGAESGVIKKYYENGSLESEQNFNGGILDSTSVKTYQKKEIQAAEGLGRFTGNGYYKSTNNNGQVVYDGVWKDGKFVDGNRFIYSDTGKLIKVHLYKNGQKIGEKDPE